jgi:hypothetical protein
MKLPMCSLAPVADLALGSIMQHHSLPHATNARPFGLQLILICKLIAAIVSMYATF